MRRKKKTELQQQVTVGFFLFFKDHVLITFANPVAQTNTYAQAVVQTTRYTFDPEHTSMLYKATFEHLYISLAENMGFLPTRKDPSSHKSTCFQSNQCMRCAVVHFTSCNGDYVSLTNVIPLHHVMGITLVSSLCQSSRGNYDCFDLQLSMGLLRG